MGQLCASAVGSISRVFLQQTSRKEHSTWIQCRWTSRNIGGASSKKAQHLAAWSFEMENIWNLKAIRSKSFLALVTGFGTLIGLIAILGLGALRRADTINREMNVAQASFLETESFRNGIATDMYLAGILVRDYLLDPSPANASQYRRELLDLRASLQKRLDLLPSKISVSDNVRLTRLQQEVQSYWDSLDPMFTWTTQEKSERSWRFLRRNVYPHREAVEELAREMARINQQNLDREQERIQKSQQDFESFLLRIMLFALGLGGVVALLTTYRVATLENRDDDQRQQIKDTEDSLRRLSRRLVQAQEGERKTLSRELHDEVGQTLTALGIEIANLESLRSDEQEFRVRMVDAKRLNADAMRAIRDLAMGLRPSMLDDLGLAPALEWQGREFLRHTGVPASIQVEGALDDLSDVQRTCIYRIVQEALTNCARHAEAKTVLVGVHVEGDRVVVVVQDDGRGFNIAKPQVGLGLLGIRERVQALDGTVSISSQIARGTTIRVEIPTGVTT